MHLQAYPGISVEALRRVLGISRPATVRVIDRLAADRLLGERAQSVRGMLDALDADEQARLEPLLAKLTAALAEDRPRALHVCRMCDRGACTQDPGCPLDHTSEGAQR